MRGIVPLLVVLLTVLLFGCTSIDCPLNSAVHCRYVLSGNVTTLSDTLTIYGQRENKTDTLLLNKAVGISNFSLPLSFRQPTDVLFLSLTSDSSMVKDTVRIHKQSQPHFESVECPATYFHTLNKAEWTTHAIDSIIISKSKVNYDTTGGNILIYFKSAN